MLRKLAVYLVVAMLIVGSIPGVAALELPEGETPEVPRVSDGPTSVPACVQSDETLSVDAGPDFQTTKDETVRFVAELNPDDADVRVVSYEWRDSYGPQRKKGGKGRQRDRILSAEKSFETRLKAGEHTITVTVETADGRTLTDTVNVTVRGKGSGAERDSPPEADAGDCRLVVADEDTRLNGTDSYDRDGTIEQYEWDLDGDGTTDATGATPTVQFAELGNRTVELTVTDDGGNTDNDTVRLFVDDRPRAAFDYAPTRPNPGEEVVFDASSSADTLGGIDAYRWDFDGDGETDATGENVTHVFTTPGNHTVTLAVTDAYGVNNTTTATIHVNYPPTADASDSERKANVSESLTLDGTASTDPEGGIESYEWDVDGDGQFEKTGATVEHRYATRGEKNVTLRVTDDGNLTDTDEITVEVNAPPTARIESSNDTVRIGDSVVFDGSPSTDVDGEIVSYEWDVDGDGVTDATGPTVERTYETDGSHTVALTVTDDDGATDTATETVVVLPDQIDDEPPGLPAPPDDPEGGSGTGDPHYTTFDGRNYDFQAAGEFVLAREPNGSLSVQGRLVPWSSRPVSVAEAIATSLDGHNVTIDAADATPLVVDGTRHSLEPTDRLAVGNGTVFRRGSKYVVVYPGADGEVDDGDERLTVELRSGFVDVWLTLRDDRAKPVEGILGTPAEDAPDVALANGTAVSPSDYGAMYGPFRDDWRVDSLAESHFHYETGESPDSFYDPDYPTELVTLADLSDDERAEAEEAAEEAGLEPGSAAFRNAVLDYALTGDDSFLTSAATSQPANASFAVEAGSSFEANVSTATTFVATVENESAANVTVEWRFGDGTTATGTEVTHTYDETGTYTVTVTATGPNGGVARDTLAVTVGENVTTDQPPIADVAVTRPNETHARLDASESIDPDGNVTGYAWDTDGDGTVEAYGETVTVVLESASPEVSLVVLDDDGNRASETVRVNSAPEADATASPTTAETGETVTFDASNSTDPDGDSLTYEWDFDGDGTTDATGETVTKAFDDTGTYNVTLTVSDGIETDADTVSVSVSSRVLFRESFEDGNYDGWNVLNGDWYVSSSGADSGTYNLRSTEKDSVITYSEQFPHDATYEVSGLVESGYHGDLNVYFNYKDANNYYEVRYYPAGTDNPTFSILRHVDGTTTTLAEKSPDIGTERWIDITINRTASGETTVAVHAPSTGTTQTLTVMDDELTGSGKLGFRTWTDGQSRFDNITVVAPANTAPDAEVSVNETTVTAGETVTFDASNSTDPDGDSLTYEWDFDGDGTTDATGETVNHSYSASGTYDVAVTVTDEQGASSTDTVTVSVESPTTVVDDFEDGDLSEYGGDTGEATIVTSPVYEGSFALRMQSQSGAEGSFSGVYSTNGLPAYPERGDNFSVRFRIDGRDTKNEYSIVFGAQSERDQARGNYITFDGNSDELIFSRDGGNGKDAVDSASLDVSQYADEWLKYEINWRGDGFVTIALYDSSGTKIKQVSGQAPYSSGGIGIYVNERTRYPRLYVDEIVIEE